MPETKIASRRMLRDVSVCIVWHCRDGLASHLKRDGEWWPVCTRHLRPFGRKGGHFHFQDADDRVCDHQHRSATARCGDVRGRPMVCFLPRQKCVERYWKRRALDWQHKWLYAEPSDGAWVWTCHGCGEERETPDLYPPPSDLYDRCGI